MSSVNLTSHEVVEQIRRAIRGEAVVKLAPTYKKGINYYNGQQAFYVGDWFMIFFNDSGELDYCDLAQSPDGRMSDYCYFYDTKQEPIEMLTEDELCQFQEILSKCVTS